MRIGLIGGSFNPPHKIHLEVAINLKEKGYVDKVIYIPNIRNPYHDKILIPPRDRYEMVKLMIQDYDYLEVSDIEIRHNRQYYTYETMDIFSKQYPDDDIFFIMGSDNLLEIEHWANYEYLLKTYKIIVIKRDIDDINKIINDKPWLKPYKHNIVIIENKESSSLSSTLIKEMISKDQDVEAYLDTKVYDYIKEHHYYEK